MKLLHAASQTCERLSLLLSLTKISSDDIQAGLKYHLVKGFDVNNAAQLAGVKQPNLKRALDTLEMVAKSVEAIKELDFNHLTDINKDKK